MRALRSLLVPALFGLALLTIALITRSGIFARDNPGMPINSAMREAMHMMVLAPADEAFVSQHYPNASITSTGLRYLVTTPGNGLTKPQRGDVVSVEYRSAFIDGTPLDDSYKNEGPYQFPAGLARVIPGWDEAVMDMSVGERRTLIVPYWLGYGENGIKGHIPGKITLIFEVNLTGITRKQ
ncbi:MAG: FKBP-type peptidyl-prolyl cis-trans isomerase [Candidatus Synoicihabitans palmerolidicus]|nr:FKBP-type peptidyl-prolyl cis-trans isomerase [Candidatus Synoicihabitans palmerolidicus]